MRIADRAVTADPVKRNSAEVVGSSHTGMAQWAGIMLAP
jgi:hypothetical protein